MPRNDTFPLVDRIVPGGLAGFLADAREPDENGRRPSFEDIAYRLRDEHDIKVSNETIRKWCRRTGIVDDTTDTAGAA